MKNTYIAIVVLVLIVLGFVFFISKGNKAEAPISDTEVPRDLNTEKKVPAAEIPADYNAPVSATTAPVKEFTVTGENFTFAPNVITVKKGDLVKINFKNANGFHDLRIDEFKVATHQIKGGAEESVSFIADQTGEFQYYCSVGSHRAMGMWGTLKVE